MMLSSLPLGIILLLLSSTSALQVTPGSTCASACLDSDNGNTLEASASTTNSSDIVCNDTEYFSSSTGSKFKSCVNCLQTSNAVNGSESDISWFLYNLRYASAVCLYDFPTHSTNATTPCNLEFACAPIQGALESKNLSTEDSEYTYCAANSGSFNATNVNNCAVCLQSSDQTYLSNFLLALQAGCQQEPAAGALLGISGDIFTSTAINITAAAASSKIDQEYSIFLSTGAIIGIVVGASVLFLSGVALFIVYWRRQKCYEKEDDTDGHVPQEFYHKDRRSDNNSSITTANSYVLPHYTVDYKSGSNPTPMSVAQAPAGPGPIGDYASNAEYYDHVEGKSRGRPLKMMTQQSDNTEVDSVSHHVNSALPIHPAYIPRSQFGSDPHLGGRPSRNPCTRLSKQSSIKSNKPDGYAIQVYLNAVEDVKVSPPPPAAQPSVKPFPASKPLAQALPAITTRFSEGQTAMPSMMNTQFSGPRNVSTSEAVPGPAQASTPSPPMDGSGPAKVPSLILPSVPRIRVPSKKPPRIMVQDATPIERDNGGSVNISGPLAFPDGRFTHRPDHIIEQTVVRGQTVEVPIGSGKSYLYG